MTQSVTMTTNFLHKLAPIHDEDCLYVYEDIINMHNLNVLIIKTAFNLMMFSVIG